MPTPGRFPPPSPGSGGAAARSRPHPAAGRDPLLSALASLVPRAERPRPRGRACPGPRPPPRPRPPPAGERPPPARRLPAPAGAAAAAGGSRRPPPRARRSPGRRPEGLPVAAAPPASGPSKELFPSARHRAGVGAASFMQALSSEPVKRRKWSEQRYLAHGRGSRRHKKNPRPPRKAVKGPENSRVGCSHPCLQFGQFWLPLQLLTFLLVSCRVRCNSGALLLCSYLYMSAQPASSSASLSRRQLTCFFLFFFFFCFFSFFFLIYTTKSMQVVTVNQAKNVSLNLLVGQLAQEGHKWKALNLMLK